MYAISQRSALIIKKVLVFPRLYARQCHQRSFRHAKPDVILFIRRLVQTRRTSCQLPSLSLTLSFLFFFSFLFLGFPFLFFFFFFFFCRGEKEKRQSVRKQMEKFASSIDQLARFWAGVFFFFHASVEEDSTIIFLSSNHLFFSFN